MQPQTSLVSGLEVKLGHLVFGLGAEGLILLIPHLLEIP
jgi:hypothetical protein